MKQIVEQQQQKNRYEKVKERDGNRWKKVK